MKKTHVFLILIALFTMPLAATAEQDKGPEAMDLKERFKVEGKKSAVIFPHRQHQEKLECEKCHVDSKGGGKVKFELVNLTGPKNDFHTKFCWPCHQEMSVPKGKSCKTCHK
jgi:hypothetical protein